MIELSRTEDLNDADIRKLIDFAIASGGIDYSYAVMQRLRDEAATIIGSFTESDVTRAFMSIFDYIIDRDK